MKKKLQYVLMLGFGFFFLGIHSAHAALAEPHKGAFIGAGGILGYEVNRIKHFGGGAASQYGYRFSDKFGAYLEGDFFFDRKFGVNYENIFVIPTAMYNFYKGLFGYVGVGYRWVRATAGPRFGNVTLVTPTMYNGFIADAGLGYEFWFNDHLVLTPELGGSYSRIAKTNLGMVNARVLLSYHF